MEGIYRIADRVIRIVSFYEKVHKICSEYRCNEDPELEVIINREDLLREKEKSIHSDINEGRDVKERPEGYLESLAVYRKICEWMPLRDTFLFHGSAVAVDGKAYLFTAKSGTGKSTHARLWRELLGERAVMINDDKPLIRIMEKGAVVYGTPWNGKHKLGGNLSAPLRAVCILRRSDKNYIRKIQKNEAYPILLQQAYRPVG